MILQMQLKIRDLPPDLLEAAKTELHEDPLRRDADLKHIRDWLEKQPHIKANPDDQVQVLLYFCQEFYYLLHLNTWNSNKKGNLILQIHYTQYAVKLKCDYVKIV
jgi:hypothetical protein